jgi:hypothetical protein
MTPFDLNHQLARQTGESVRRIRRMGFTLIAPRRRRKRADDLVFRYKARSESPRGHASFVLRTIRTSA